MATSYGALCTDFYVNSKLTLKMDLPSGRETVLDLFERVRRERPHMRSFKRYRGELALESPDDGGQYEWVALRRTTIRAGSVNPETMDDAQRLHALVYETAPFYLGINPLDIEAFEVLLGFDLEAPGNHSGIVYKALYENSPLAELVGADQTPPIDVQPIVGVQLSERDDLAAYFEVRTRSSAARPVPIEGAEDPISVYLTIRSTQHLDDVRNLPERLRAMTAEAERLAETRVVPHLLTPLREAIAASRF